MVMSFIYTSFSAYKIKRKKKTARSPKEPVLRSSYKVS